jgi:hypothetical protein
LNPLNNSADNAPSAANLTFRNTTASYFLGSTGTIDISSGKWYWESTITAVGGSTQVGIIPSQSIVGKTTTSVIDYANNVLYTQNGNKYVNTTSSAYGSTYTTNDVIGVALDLDAGTITFYKNNTTQGTAATGLSGSYVPVLSGSNSSIQNINFGQRPFQYSAPSGFKALNTFNLP